MKTLAIVLVFAATSTSAFAEGRMFCHEQAVRAMNDEFSLFKEHHEVVGEPEYAASGDNVYYQFELRLDKGKSFVNVSLQKKGCEFVAAVRSKKKKDLDEATDDADADETPSK